LAKGVAMVTEDRQGWGLVGTMTVRENLMLGGSGGGLWLRKGEEERLAREWCERLRIKVAGLGQRVGELSGGNQQKVILARALATGPELLILDEPTRGIDVGAKAEIYELIRELRDKGMAILLVSSELPEVMALSDRIVVMSEGYLTAEFTGEAATEAALLEQAMPRGRAGLELNSR
jgi:ABC-type sugar transport system ATPase subunit